MTENLELREWIAVNVMGVRIRHQRLKPGRSDLVIPGGVDQIDYYDPEGKLTVRDLIEAVPPYELTWNDAALVVEAMREKGYIGRISTPDPERRYWTAGFGKMPADADKFTFAIWHDGAGDTAPLAICLAAIAAMEAK